MIGLSLSVDPYHHTCRLANQRNSEDNRWFYMVASSMIIQEKTELYHPIFNEYTQGFWVWLKKEVFSKSFEINDGYTSDIHSTNFVNLLISSCLLLSVIAVWLADELLICELLMRLCMHSASPGPPFIGWDIISRLDTALQLVAHTKI